MDIVFPHGFAMTGTSGASTVAMNLQILSKDLRPKLKDIGFYLAEHKMHCATVHSKS